MSGWTNRVRRQAFAAATLGAVLTGAVFVGSTIAAEPELQPADIDAIIQAEAQDPFFLEPWPSSLGVLDPAVAAMWLEQRRAMEYGTHLLHLVPDALQWGEWRGAQLEAEYPESFAQDPVEMGEQ